MKKGWKIKKLGEVCETKAGGTPLKTHKEYYKNGNIPWLRSGEVCQKDIYNSELFITEEGLNNSSAKIFPKNTVLIAMYGATAGQVGILRFESSTNQAICGILPNDKIIPEFIYYKFLEGKDKLVKQAVGGAQPNISQIKIKNTPIPIPPLPEQKRIVSILDRAFEAIDQAKANAEQNLKNAKELFESYLNRIFSPENPEALEGWEEKKLGKVIKLEYGKPLEKSKRYSNGKYPVYGANGIKSFSDEYYYDKETIVVGRKGSAGEINLTEEKFWPLDVTYFVVFDKNEVSLFFLYFLMKTLDIPKLAKGVKPGINRNDVYNLDIIIPPIKTQKQIVAQLDKLQAETNKLEAIYQKKIEDLEELKKSILQKAFNGEL